MPFWPFSMQQIACRGYDNLLMDAMHAAIVLRGIPQCHDTHMRMDNFGFELCCRRPTYLPSMRLRPADRVKLFKDPRRRMLADYVNALADLAHPKAALPILQDEPRILSYEHALREAVARHKGKHLSVAAFCCYLKVFSVGASSLAGVARAPSNSFESQPHDHLLLVFDKLPLPCYLSLKSFRLPMPMCIDLAPLQQLPRSFHGLWHKIRCPKLQPCPEQSHGFWHVAQSNSMISRSLDQRLSPAGQRPVDVCCFKLNVVNTLGVLLDLL